MTATQQPEIVSAVAINTDTATSRWHSQSSVEKALVTDVYANPVEEGYLPIAFRGEALSYADFILRHQSARGLVADLFVGGTSLTVTLEGTGVQWDDDGEPYIEASFFSNAGGVGNFRQTIGPVMRWAVRNIERLVIV